MSCLPVLRPQRDTRGRRLRLQVPFPRSSGCTPRSGARRPPSFGPGPISASSAPAVAAPAATGHQGRCRRRPPVRRRPPCETSATGPPARTGRTPCRRGRGTGGCRQSMSAHGSPRTGQTSPGPTSWSAVDGRCGRPPRRSWRTDAAPRRMWIDVSFVFVMAGRFAGGGKASSRRCCCVDGRQHRLRCRAASAWAEAQPFFAPRCCCQKGGGRRPRSRSRRRGRA